MMSRSSFTAQYYIADCKNILSCYDKKLIVSIRCKKSRISKW